MEAAARRPRPPFLAAATIPRGSHLPSLGPARPTLLRGETALRTEIHRRENYQTLSDPSPLPFPRIADRRSHIVYRRSGWVREKGEAPNPSHGQSGNSVPPMTGNVLTPPQSESRRGAPYPHPIAWIAGRRGLGGWWRHQIPGLAHPTHHRRLDSC
jgi:hypothetical protein